VIGLGTLINMGAILVGSAVGVAVGSRLPERTRELITSALGLVVLVVAALNIVALTDADWQADVGSSAPLLIVLGSVVIGGVIGSLLRVEQRMEGVGGWLQRRMSRTSGSEARQRFIEGFVDAAVRTTAYRRHMQYAIHSNSNDKAWAVYEPGASYGTDSDP